jgi:Peptidase inhibitor I9
VSSDANPLDAAARPGVDPSSVLRGLSSFGAELTDAQVESLSNDPEVDYIVKNHWLDMA